VARGGGWPLLETMYFTGALVLNVGLAWWLIPRLGLPGATLAMAGSYGAASLWLVAMMHRRLQVTTGSWLLRTVLPRALAPAAAAAALHFVWRGADPASRPQALVAFALEGTAFLALAIALTWPTGDAKVVFARLRARLAPAQA